MNSIKKIATLLLAVLIGFVVLIPTTSTSAYSEEIDQQYAPKTYLAQEPIWDEIKPQGQSFRPTFNHITKFEIETKGQTLPLTGFLSDTTNISLIPGINTNLQNGWTTFTLPTPLEVTRNQEYRIFIDSAQHQSDVIYWFIGEEGSGGTYSRGSAILAAEIDVDFDFHFKVWGYDTGSVTDDDTDDNTSDDQTVTPGTNPEGKITNPNSKSNSDASIDGNITNPDAPPAPVNLDILNLRITGVGPSYIDLDWDEVIADDMAGYILKYGTSSGGYTTEVDVGNENNYRIEGLKRFDTYYIIVCSYDTDGNVSDPSNEVSTELIEMMNNNWWLWILIIAILLAIALFIFFYWRRKRKKKDNINTTNKT